MDNMLDIDMSSLQTDGYYLPIKSTIIIECLLLNNNKKTKIKGEDDLLKIIQQIHKQQNITKDYKLSVISDFIKDVNNVCDSPLDYYQFKITVLLYYIFRFGNYVSEMLVDIDKNNFDSDETYDNMIAFFQPLSSFIDEHNNIREYIMYDWSKPYKTMLLKY